MCPLREIQTDMTRHSKIQSLRGIPTKIDWGRSQPYHFLGLQIQIDAHQVLRSSRVQLDPLPRVSSAFQLHHPSLNVTLHTKPLFRSTHIRRFFISSDDDTKSSRNDKIAQRSRKHVLRGQDGYIRANKRVPSGHLVEKQSVAVQRSFPFVSSSFFEDLQRISRVD